jgi:hypothetical protein
MEKIQGPNLLQTFISSFFLHVFVIQIVFYNSQWFTLLQPLNMTDWKITDPC